MKSVGIVSYNIHCNFTNYGSALQSWALNQAIERLGCAPTLIDYCPDSLKNADPLNPFGLMMDRDSESQRMCKLTLPAIRENYEKFKRFYRERFKVAPLADLYDGFVCGSDTIFCIDEFNGFDDAYFANEPFMRERSVAYAASFGDAHFGDAEYVTLNSRIRNFKAIGVRENRLIPYLLEHASCPVERTVDPTLLQTVSAYDSIAVDSPYQEPYLLLYARRYNPKMEAYAIRYAAEHKLKVVEISLRATNAERGHVMRYDAGVEEFLGLVRGASYVVTNSFHGLIFAVTYLRQFAVFSRESGDSKIGEVLELFGIPERLMVDESEPFVGQVDFASVQDRIACARERSIAFLKRELEML